MPVRYQFKERRFYTPQTKFGCGNYQLFPLLCPLILSDFVWYVQSILLLYYLNTLTATPQITVFSYKVTSNAKTNKKSSDFVMTWCACSPSVQHEYSPEWVPVFLQESSRVTCPMILTSQPVSDDHWPACLPAGNHTLSDTDRHTHTEDKPAAGDSKFDFCIHLVIVI